MDTTNFIMFIYFIILVSLDHTNCKDDVLVKSCPQDKHTWDTAARRKGCKPEGGRDYVFHCLKNEGQLVETCLVAQWIEIGVCPVLFNGGNFGFENCSLIMLRTGEACPKTPYRSNELYNYPICFDKICPKTTMTHGQLNTTTEITTVRVTSTLGDGYSNIGGMVWITAAVIVPLLVFGIIIIVISLIYKRREDNGREAGIEHRQERSEDNYPFLPNTQLTGPPIMNSASSKNQ